MTHSVLASAVNHPDAINPYIGLFNQRIVQSLMHREIDVDVVSPRPFAPPVGPHSEYSMLPTVEGWNGYDVHHPRFFYLLPKRFFYGAAGDSFAKRVPEYVEETFETPDVVHACHIYLDGYGMAQYCEEHDVPLFVVSHGHFMNDYDELSDGVREKVDVTLDVATKVLCVSDALARKASKHVPRSKVEVVPIGATPSRYPVERKEALRDELGIDRDATVALFVGEFCERKGIPELVDILPELDLAETEFAFVGHGGDEEWNLRRALTSSQFSARHVYTGITSLALRRWLTVADVLVLPSHAEGRPTVIYEAMASETAVLSTPVGGIPEQVEDGETGVLIPPGDAGRLRDELQTLASDRDRLLEMGERGRERLVERGWTWDNHASRVQRLHREALE